MVKMSIDAEDIAFSIQAYLWDELVNTYKVPSGLASFIALQVEDLVKEYLTEVEGDRPSSTSQSPDSQNPQ